MSSPSTHTFGGRSIGYRLFVELFFNRKIQNVKCVDGPNNNLKTKYNIQIKYLCCDNIGENGYFERACKQEWMGIKFEYTALWYSPIE